MMENVIDIGLKIFQHNKNWIFYVPVSQNTIHHLIIHSFVNNKKMIKINI